MSTLNVKIIIGSTRANRFSEKPSQWMAGLAAARQDLSVEVLDLRHYPLPFFEEPLPPGLAKDQYDNPVVQKWRTKVLEGDAFIICSPEYNHGYPAVLKNAFTRALTRRVELAVALEGAGGMLAGGDAPQDGFWQKQVMGQFSARIGGGTEEVHRNMIGERALGLPAEPRADKDVPWRDLPRS